ncbi:signal recognition particle receptor subunit alpha, partial [Actinophytocola sp.]|uniref:signal recognition particle receptor subunit alpha n=1 Tax=Actinophytocola sp. TaxID=1872138 RepID=UPI002D8090BB
MSTTLIVVLVAVLVVLVLAVVVGVVLARRRRIDLTERGEERSKPAGYRAGGGIALAPGGERPVEAPQPVEVEVEPEPEPEAAAPVEAEPAAPATEEIEPTSGRLERLRGRLSRSRSAFGSGLLGLLGAGDLDEDSWTEVEDTLLLADLGAATTAEVVERLRGELVARGVRTPEQARATLREVLVEALHPDMDRAVRALPHGTA